MYPYRVVETQEFLTGTLAGFTLTASYGICSPDDYDAAAHVGTVRKAVMSRRTTYRVVAARVERTEEVAR